MSFYRRIFKYVTGEWRWVLLLTLLIIFLVALSTLSAWPLALLIDCITGHPKTGLLASICGENIYLGVGLIIGSFFVIKFLQDGLSLCRSMVGLRIKYNVTQRVRGELFAHLQTLGSVFFKSNAQGDAIFRLTNDTYGAYGVFDTMLTSIQAAASLICIVAVMLTRNVSLTLFAVSLAPFLAFANWHFGRKIKQRTDVSRQVDADLITLIQRSVSTLKITELFSRRVHEIESFDGAQLKSIDAALSLNWQENLYPFAVQVLFGLGQVSILAVGSYLVLNPAHTPNAHPITCGELVLFLTYFNQILDPLSLVFGYSARVKGSVAATERVFTILDQQSNVAEDPHAERIAVKQRTLALENVWFHYPGASSPVLCGLNARIEAGSLAAFVGPSGAGKSTLLDLLARLSDPSSGRILLDGHDLRTLPLNCIRQHIAVVSQDYAVLPTTIFENIRYGNPDATDAEVYAAAVQAGVDNLVVTLEHGYQTVISEGGQNLSAGQRQRIAIARALLMKAPILILDEPSSALDPQQERLLMQTLQRLKQKHTIVLVTHRLDTVAGCDDILVMRHGRIFEHGTHRELLAQRGVYYQMLHAQRGKARHRSDLPLRPLE